MNTISKNNYSISFYLPTKIIFEKHSLEKLFLYLKENKLTKTLLIISQGTLERLPTLMSLFNKINSITGIKITPYIIESHTKASTQELLKIKKRLSSENFDSLISVGGGNILDLGKAASICVDESVQLETLVGSTFEHVNKKLFHIAVPTTFGTGSEVTKGAIILDSSNGNKDGVRGRAIFPDIALIDSTLGHTLPDNVLRETIFDSFTHAFEAIQAVKQNRFIELFALEALSLINNIVDKYAKGNIDDQFYDDIAYVALLGGICVCHNSTCLPHRFEQALSPIYKLSHGAGLAAFYPEWIKFLIEYHVEKPLPNNITQGMPLNKYVEKILRKLKLNTLIDTLKMLDMTPTDISKRIKGNIINDPLVNKIGNEVINLLAINYSGKKS
ncbi:iron-containing alcohol dehydrogenase family protein [Xenorhabdus thuongxuanensis]|uniref:Iron-containing alcohol dehydrogenase family protein RfbM n=1 Tax=Xenorhabdus thuongxuanensis TaxID=1873484 RepID=A0A1Q5U5R4_9GAMM|nr:iron-containing alcohol dehydrogenase [Xenorhabdus thuongxuanensis]OKP07823.1 iron-containing alcohol dehydrogenase family protein RfbM [Xenorhabdus thuongxuanensis]